MIRGPPGPGAIMSPPNDEFAQTPARPIVWRRPRWAGAWADGTNRYEGGEPPLRPRGVPGRRGPRAPFRRAGRAGLPRGAGIRHLRRGGRALQARARVPQVRLVALEGRPRAVRPAAVEAPLVRGEARLPHGHRLRGLGGRPADVGPLHPPDEARRAAGLRRWAVRREPPDRLRVAPQGARRGVGPPGASCCAAAPGWTGPTSTTRTCRRAAARRASAASPARGPASSSPSTCARTRPPRSAGTASPARRGSRSALAGRLSPGCVVVHDRERAHSGAIADSGCVSESYRADCRDPAYLEAMEMVDSMCPWPKRYLRRFTGMSPANMQLYLDWYVYLFRVNQARDRWGPTARVLRHMMMAPARFRSSRQPTNHLSS